MVNNSGSELLGWHLIRALQHTLQITFLKMGKSKEISFIFENLYAFDWLLVIARFRLTAVLPIIMHL